MKQLRTKEGKWDVVKICISLGGTAFIAIFGYIALCAIDADNTSVAASRQAVKNEQEISKIQQEIKANQKALQDKSDQIQDKLDQIKDKQSDRYEALMKQLLEMQKDINRRNGNP